MNFSPQVLKIIFLIGIPSVIFCLLPFGSLLRIKRFLIVSLVLYLVQGMVIGCFCGISASAAGFGRPTNSPWDGPSAQVTLMVFNICNVFLEVLIRVFIKHIERFMCNGW